MQFLNNTNFKGINIKIGFDNIYIFQFYYSEVPDSVIEIQKLGFWQSTLSL